MTEESEDEDVVHRHQLQWCSHGKQFVITCCVSKHVYTAALQSLKQLLDSRVRSAGVVSGRYVQKTRMDGAASSSPVVSGSPSWAVKRSLQNNDTATTPMRNITNTALTATTPNRNTISAPTTLTTRHDHSSSFQSTDQLR